MTLSTYLAIGELVQAAAHQKGVVGPVEFTVCRTHEPETHGTDDQPGSATAQPVPSVPSVPDQQPTISTF